jgi:hypothetical protein
MTGYSATRCTVPVRWGARIAAGVTRGLSKNRYAALVWAQVPQAWSIGAVRCSLRPSTRWTKRWAKRSHRPPAGGTAEVGAPHFRDGPAQARGLLSTPPPPAEAVPKGMRKRTVPISRGCRRTPVRYVGISAGTAQNRLRRPPPPRTSFQGGFVAFTEDLWVRHSLPHREYRGARPRRGPPRRPLSPR